MSNKKYEVSVIIPSHNTDPKFFKHCIDSVKSQTFGFENIELIVVFHNCDEAREKELRAIVGDHENVKMYTLKNDIHSPSSPRNQGLDMATGDYIGFLDADDKYTPECLSSALRYIKETDSDILHFRRMVELEKPVDIVMNEIVLWDQTRETIVIDLENDDWNPDEYYVAQWSMTTHKLYRRAFIEENHIRFSTDIVIAEDSEFSAQVYGKAKRLCLAPQLIGYVYYINTQSIVQSPKIDADELVEYANSFKLLFDSLEKNGIDPSESVAGLTLLLAGYVFKLRDSMTPEARKQIKDALEPYIRKKKQIPPSKIYPPGRIERMNTLPQLLLLGEPAHEKHFFIMDDQNIPDTFAAKQGQTLQKIIEESVNTDFGKRYGFGSISSVEDYRDAMPITDYDVYHPMIELTSKIGETGIFTCKPITSHVLSYGNIGVRKELPVTAGAMERYVDIIDGLIGTDRFFPMFESLPYEPSVHSFVNVYTNTLFPLIYNTYAGRMLQKRENRPSMVTPSEIMFPTELHSFEYVRLVFALADKSVETILAPNAWVLYSGIRRIIRDYKTICADIREGNLSNIGDISEELLGKISWRLSSSPDRADELLKLFEQGDFSLKKIWPRLHLIIADGTGSYTVYKKKAGKYIDGISYTNGILADEVCMYGEALPDEDQFRLDPSSAYYEFMDEDGTIRLSFELKEQQKYRLIVTTENGLFRYKSDMFVRPVKIAEDEIIVEKCCPVNYDLDALNGIYEEDVYGAIVSLEEKYGISFSDFSLIKDVTEDELLLIIESESEENYQKALSLDMDDVRDFIWGILREKASRQDESFRVYFCEPETGFMCRDQDMYRMGILPDSVYPVHMSETYSSRKKLQN